MLQRRFQFRPVLGPSLALLLAACGQQTLTAPSQGARTLQPLGDLSLIRTYAGVAFSDVAVDAGGHLFVVGDDRTAPVIARYDAGGVQAWSQRLPDPARGYNPAGREVALDAQGNVYAIGGARFEAGLGGDVLAKYTPGGALQWAMAQGQTYGGADPIEHLAVDPAGNALVSGYIQDVGQYLEKHTLDGALAWRNRLPDDLDLGDLAADASGRFFHAYAASGNITLRKLTPGGAVIGTKTWAGSRVIRVASRFGSVYTLYTKASGETRLNKYDANSVWQWSRVVSGGAVDLTIDPKGNLYLLGTNAANDVYVDRYEPERGRRQWTKTFDDGDLSPQGVAVDAAGQVSVVGGISYSTFDPDPAHENVGYIAQLRP